MRLLRAGQVLTGRPGEAFADGEVLIEGPRITHVGAGGSAPEVTGTEVAELPGCTLMPGLIDSHVHIGFDQAVDHALNGSITESVNVAAILKVEVLLRRDPPWPASPWRPA